MSSISSGSMIVLAVASGLAATAARWFVQRAEAPRRRKESQRDVQRWEDEGGLVPSGKKPFGKPFDGPVGVAIDVR